MKKSFKLIALFLAIAMLSVSLCSCRALDDAKENRAFYTSADRTEIEYKGNIYRLMNLGKYNFLDYGIGGNAYYVTPKDVPVLLNSWYGEWMYVGNNEAYIVIDDYDSNYSSYVREDLYDDIHKVVESRNLDCYFVEYWDDFDYDRPDSERYHAVIVDDNVKKVIKNALYAPVKDRVSPKELSSYQNIIHLGTCDSNKILKNSVYYYLVQDKDNYYFWDSNSQSDLIALDKKDSKVIEKVFSDYPLAIVYDEQISWYFDNDDNYAYYYDDDYEDTVAVDEIINSL